MKFSDKYPNAKPGDIVGDNFLVGFDTGSCIECGRITNFIDLDSEGYICSEECDKAWYDEFFKACKKL